MQESEEAKSFNTIYTNVFLESRKVLGHCRSHRYQVDILHSCMVYSLASLKFLFSVFTHCLGSALLYLYTILLYSPDAICNSGKTNTEPALEIGTRMLMKMSVNQTGAK